MHCFEFVELIFNTDSQCENLFKQYLKQIAFTYPHQYEINTYTSVLNFYTGCQKDSLK
jgi:hypothetical protein